MPLIANTSVALSCYQRMKAVLRNYGDFVNDLYSLKYMSPGGDPGSCTEEREKEILLARSVFLRCHFLLAQKGVPFLLCIYDEHEQRCNRCYGKKYFHAPRIAWKVESAFCNKLTAAKQICKA